MIVYKENHYKTNYVIRPKQKDCFFDFNKKLIILLDQSKNRLPTYPPVRFKPPHTQGPPWDGLRPPGNPLGTPGDAPGTPGAPLGRLYQVYLKTYSKASTFIFVAWYCYFLQYLSFSNRITFRSR